MIGPSRGVLSGVAPLALLLFVGCGTAPADRESDRLLVFGIDGGDWESAVVLMRQGKLPALARLSRTGVRRTLRSLEPERLSPTIWTTIATGVLPERHKIHHFVTNTPEGIAPITSNQREVAALWNILNARGLSVGVVGWLATWPVERVDGYMISSYTPYVFNWGPEKPIKGTFVDGVPDQVWPPELGDAVAGLKIAPDEVSSADLSDRFTGREIPETPAADAAKSLDGMRWSWAADATYERMFHYASEHPPGGRRPDVEMTYFASVDVISHRFWKYKDPDSYPLGRVEPREVDLYGRAIENAYRSLDGVLTRILARDEAPERVLVLSDHGFRENRDTNRATSSGWHRPEGMLMAQGTGFRRGEVLSAGTVVDVTPTVLYSLGLPVADDMDGRPALDLFTEDFRSRHELSTISSYEPEARPERDPGAPVASAADEEILSRLEALGYLD